MTASRPTGSSRLGFGCARIVGPTSTAEAQALLGTAYDSGITHFDVARVYGTGDAERVLGRFLAAGHPAHVVTKFGIRPMANTRTNQALKHVARAAMRRAAPLARLVRKRASVTATRGLFDPSEALASLAESSSALADHPIGGFLLHDATLDDWASDGLRAALDELVGAGRIGNYGTATEIAETASILGSEHPCPPVLQCRDDLTPHALELIRIGEERAAHVVTFGPLAYTLGPVLARASADERYARSLADVIGAEVSADTVADAVLALALHRNPTGTVVFSSQRADRVRRAAAIAAAAPLGDDQAAAITAAVQSARG